MSSNHITYNRSFFKFVAGFNVGKIQFGDNSVGTVIGIVNTSFNESYDITKVHLSKDKATIYLVGTGSKIQKTRCIIEENSRKAILSRSRDKSCTYILDFIKETPEHIRQKCVHT